MDQRYLPDPSKFGTQCKAGGTLESVMFGGATPNAEPEHIFQLPPIREQHFDHDVLSSSEMSRRPSSTSASSTTYSEYHLSRPGSPAMNVYLEPSYDHSSPVNRAAMHTGHFGPPQMPTQPATKVVRVKRKDRKHFSQLRNDGENKIKISKEQGEAGRRYDHSQYFALMQRQLLAINPNLPRAAYHGKSRKGVVKKLGWTPLKSNNRSMDVEEDEEGKFLAPLAYNKNNMFSSTYHVIDHSSALNESVIEYETAIQKRAGELTQPGTSEEDKDTFIRSLARSDAASRIATASAQRGSTEFQIPFYGS